MFFGTKFSLRAPKKTTIWWSFLSVLNYDMVSCIYKYRNIMNVFRSVIASLFVLIIAFALEAVAISISLDRLIVPKNATVLIKEAKISERVVAALPDMIKGNKSIPEIDKIPVEYINRIVLAAVSVNDAETIIKRVFVEGINYLRGDSETISKIDFSAIEKRSLTEAKKILPGIAGTQLATLVKTQFSNSGLSNGVQIPLKWFEAARNMYSLVYQGTVVAMVGILIMMVTLFFVSSNSTHSRLNWCAVPLLAAGILSAGCGYVISEIVPKLHISFMDSFSSLGMEELAADAVVLIGAMLARNIYSVATIYIISGIVLILLSFTLFKNKFVQTAETVQSQPL